MIAEIYSLKERILAVLFCTVFIMTNCQTSHYSSDVSRKKVGITIEYITKVRYKYVLDTILVKEWLYSKALSPIDSMIVGACYHSDGKIATPTRVLSIIYGETRFGLDILNESSGAFGLMQCLRSSAKAVNMNYDSLKYTDYAIMCGTAILRLHYKYRPNINGAIIDYSGGGYTIMVLKNIEERMLWKYILVKQLDEWGFK